MTERVFLGWGQPLLPLAARFLAERYARGGVLPLRHVTLVLHGARGGRRLKELLVEEANGRGVRLVPPRVLTTSVLPELFYRPSRVPAPASVARQALAAVLREAASDALPTVLGELPDPADLVGWDRLAGKVLRLQREVAGAGFAFGDVARRCAAPGELHFDDSDRWRLLADLQGEYAERLLQLGYSDLDLERIAALEREGLACETDLWLVGVAELPQVARALLRRATSPSGALIHAPAAEAAGFDALGCIEAAAWIDRRLPVSDDQIQVGDRPSDQAAAVVRRIAGLGAASVADVVVGAADDELVPFLDEWLGSAGVTVHFGGGRPIERSGPYRLLRAIADYLDGREWEEFAALIRHPAIDTWLGSTPGGGSAAKRRQAGAPDDSVAKIADRFFSIHLPVRLARPLPSGRYTGRMNAVLRRLESRDLLGALKGRKPLNEWAAPIFAVLAKLFGGRPLNRQRPADRGLIAVLERLHEAGTELDRLPRQLAPACDAPAAIRLLLDMLGGASIPGEAEAASVELVGWLELALDDAPHVVVTGVNEGKLPESVNADAFLPDRLRSELGLLDNRHRYARDAFHLTALLHSRVSVALIAGRTNGMGDPLRPSRLLLTDQGTDLAKRVITIAGTSAGHGPAETPLTAVAAPRSSFCLPPVRSLEFEPPSSLAVTSFRRALADPYRFVLEQMFGLESLHDESRELDALGFGSLAHRILQRFGRGPEVHSDDAATVNAALERLLEEEAARTYGRSAQAAVYLQIEILRLRLQRFAEWQANRVAGGWVVKVVEGGAAGSEPALSSRTALAEFDVDGVPIELRGRIDRIDHHPESGRWAVLDYKTGDRPDGPEETHRRRSPKQWTDLQLPLYRHLVAGMSWRDDTPAVSAGGNLELTFQYAASPMVPAGAHLELGYITLSRDLDAVGERMADWSEADLLDADETAREVVRRLRRGVVEFDPSARSGWAGDPLAPLLGRRLLIAAGGGDGPEVAG